MFEGNPEIFEMEKKGLEGLIQIKTAQNFTDKVSEIKMTIEEKLFPSFITVSAHMVIQLNSENLLFFRQRTMEGLAIKCVPTHH